MRIVTFALLALFFTACKSSGPAPVKNTETSTEKPMESQNLEPLYCNEIAKDEELLDSSRFSATNILSFKVKEGCACIKYEYSGCTEGETLLVWNGEWNESNRPEVMMKLLVLEAGNCDQLLTDSACFSMKPMQLVGNQVLVFLNTKDNNLLLNYNQKN